MGIHRRTVIPFLVALAGGLVAFGLAYGRGMVLAVVLGASVVLAGAAALRTQRPLPAEADHGRRRFLKAVGLLGAGFVAGGATVGRVVDRLTRPDPGPALQAMARDLGGEILQFIKRGYYPGRSGDLQLILAPFTISNYANESLHLAPRDPRTSHAGAWHYLQRVPIVVYAPGVVEPGDRTDRVTLADLAPTTALLMGFDFPAPDGSPLPGLRAPARPPRVIVTFVIDGGGWNALTRWPEAWPTLKRLARAGMVYRNAVLGSFPAVTASAHVTIGTGAFPRTHGIPGHNMREGGKVVQPYGRLGRADPSNILVPTLADAWGEHTGNRAWVGLLAYQVWHLGMIGRGGAAPGDRAVATYWDEDRNEWASQNPDLYRLPLGLPPRSTLSDYLRRYHGEERAVEMDRRTRQGARLACCSPPIVRYQGDMIAAALEHEPIGTDDVTDLVYINYKAPDYAGHVFNVLSMRERIALAAVDRELGRLVEILERRFQPGEFVLIVTADHGQSPLPDATGGTRVDPIQLAESLERAFGHSIWRLVQAVRPSEIYVDPRALWDAGVSLEELAVELRGYRYRDNIGPYIPGPAILRDRLDARLFAAVLPRTFIETLPEEGLEVFGPGRYPGAEPGIPPITW